MFWLLIRLGFWKMKMKLIFNFESSYFRNIEKGKFLKSNLEILTFGNRNFVF